MIHRNISNKILGGLVVLMGWAGGMWGTLEACATCPGDASARGRAQSNEGCRVEGVCTGALQEGDLLFQAGSGSEFSKAISEATSCCCMDFVHVGIFAVIEGDSVVIEASSKEGVVTTPLQDFLAEAAVVAMRYPDREVAQRAVTRAVGVLGQPYDWEFAADNGRMYCSELVQYSYIDAEGKPIFESIPMNFADADGKIPEFWSELFSSMGKPVPQGAPGTNPNSIYSHPGLIQVKF